MTDSMKIARIKEILKYRDDAFDGQEFRASYADLDNVIEKIRSVVCPPKIVFDVDDILWPLNKHVAKITGIDYEKFITFLLFENPNFTNAEKELILKTYQDPGTFENIEWYPGIDRIMALEQYGCEIYINSNCSSKKVLKLKEKQLLYVLNISKEHLILNLIDIDQSKTKKMIPNTYIFVDDSPHNILQSDAKYNIMLEVPWNSSDDEKIKLQNTGKNIIFCKDLFDIIRCIKNILATDRINNGI